MTEKMGINNRYRLLARIVLEAETPIAIGSGEKSITTDATVVKDVNGMPYIPGTTLAGILRHAIGENSTLFGSQDQGSEVIFSDAKMIGAEGVAIEGLRNDLTSAFYNAFRDLPVRQHVRINGKGAADKHGKFDEEVVYKGTRFCFEIEILSNSGDSSNMDKIVDELTSAEFRIGHGSRKGFGKMRVVSCQTKAVDLTDAGQRKWYLSHTSSLAADFQGEAKEKKSHSNAITYALTLQPEDFFLFGSGFGDNEVDLKPVREKMVAWHADGTPEIIDDAILMPASSLKGALLHRVAYHYNKIKGYYAGDERAKAGTDNEAVRTLFGYAAEGDEQSRRGIVLFEDIIEKSEAGKEPKIFNHVSIDRFTGGAIDGALFSEKADYGKGKTFATTITLLTVVPDDVRQAFEAALTDITTGMLPLGGGVNKGYGCFTGEWTTGKEDKQ